MKKYISISLTTLTLLAFQSTYTSFLDNFSFTSLLDNPFFPQFDRSKQGYWTGPDDNDKPGYFNKLTDVQNQREDWYAQTPYIAEYWCALSNIGFIAVGTYFGSKELLFAGTASFISHSIPKQSLLYLDKFGVGLVLLKIIWERRIFFEKPELVGLIAAGAALNMTDVYFARKKGKTVPHVAWHLGGALLAGIFLYQLQK